LRVVSFSVPRRENRDFPPTKTSQRRTNVGDEGRFCHTAPNETIAGAVETVGYRRRRSR
jgi:hypothetical protein